ncbi:hypothetical protein FGO68_gene14412 [Halteria grandinella]|uniref:Uncharacterized protein n=1 Tax=Halteria grandinella TaxID=5974 RepID=A0A8J8NKX8_HALGN|nr:hypothetical protein FGO68_gene14412 [Halteria grandinella]
MSVVDKYRHKSKLGKKVQLLNDKEKLFSQLQGNSLNHVGIFPLDSLESQMLNPAKYNHNKSVMKGMQQKEEVKQPQRSPTRCYTLSTNLEVTQSHARRGLSKPKQQPSIKRQTENKEEKVRFRVVGEMDELSAQDKYFAKHGKFQKVKVQAQSLLPQSEFHRRRSRLIEITRECIDKYSDAQL